MSKLTAVEWLAEKYILVGMLTTPMVERARAMERQQIEEAYNDGMTTSNGYADPSDYYAQEYKGGEQ